MFVCVFQTALNVCVSVRHDCVCVVDRPDCVCVVDRPDCVCVCVSDRPDCMEGRLAFVFYSHLKNLKEVFICPSTGQQGPTRGQVRAQKGSKVKEE